MSNSIWFNVCGQEVAVDLLRRSASRRRLAHGYAFFGPHGVGRRVVARKLAQALFCTEFPDEELDACGACAACKQVVADNHPDLLYLCKPDGKRELPIEMIVGRPERRGREGLCYELAMRPMSAHRRIAIVDDAETMNTESANALLKTLEEPPPGSLLILLATSPEAILPTILSRVQPLHFRPLSAAEVEKLLLASDDELSKQEVTEIAALAAGSLHTARQLLDRDIRNLRTQAIEIFQAHPFHAVNAAAFLNKAIDDLGGDATAKRAQADWAFRFLVEYLRNASLAASGVRGAGDTESFLAGVSPDKEHQIDRLTDAIERVVAAERAVAEMTPVALAVEGLCDDLAAILRGADRPTLKVRGA